MARAGVLLSSVEPEEGTLTGPVQVETDANASNGAAIVLSKTATATPTPSPTSSTLQKKVILLLSDQAGQPFADYFGTHAGEADALPFDGMVFRIPSGESIHVPQVTSTETFKSELEPVRTASFQRATYNFVYTRVLTGGSLASYKSGMVSNYGNLAEAAKNAGLAGIFLDNESYDDIAWPPNVMCPGLTVEACQREAFLAGKEVMEEIAKRWPGGRLLTTMGPNLADNQAYQYVPSDNPQRQSSLIIGAFAFGLAEGATGKNFTYIDGGELYGGGTAGPHSVAQAQQQAVYRETILPTAFSLLSQTARDQWKQTVSLGYGVTDDAGGTAARMQQDIEATLPVVDEFVWAFSFYHTWYGPDIPGKQRVGQEWLNAISTAKQVEAR